MRILRMLLSGFLHIAAVVISVAAFIAILFVALSLFIALLEWLSKAGVVAILIASICGIILLSLLIGYLNED